MEKQTVIPIRLKACSDTSELYSTIHELCLTHASPHKVTLMCSASTPGKTTCVIDFPSASARIADCASQLGGRVFGFNSVILHFSINPALKCERGFPSALPSCSCTPEP